MSRGIDRVSSWKTSRRTFNSALAGAGLVLATGATRAFAQEASPAAESGSGQYLFVADPAVSTVYIYSIPDLTLTGQLDDVFFGVHNGALVLPDGRILFSDDNTKDVVAVTIDDAGVPSISQRVAVNSGDRLVWSAVDPDLRYYAGASQIPDSTTQVLNLVDLEAFTNTELSFEMLEEEELHGWVSGDYVYVSLGGQIDSYLLSDLLAGNAEPASQVPVELGSHGAVADPAHQQFLLVSNTGFEVVDIANGPAEYKGNIPWDVDGFTGGRNSRPRLHPDGEHIFGRLNPNPATPEEWADVEVSSHIADIHDLGATRTAVSMGNMGFRFGISDPYVLYAGHDGVTGAAYLVDADAGSDTYGQVVGTVPLELPTNAAQPGVDPAGTESYLTALTPDGALGFVVHGGDGTISVIDTATQEVVSTIEVPSPMTGAGYATVVDASAPLVDLFGR
ncbi:MAG: hypothetical protein KC438_05360 [Thermomicrobiales bacterium]|nr:hypothetical protein [Thermomicrobiales bacterium]MCO5221788.1 hypothetical protein [Thermomicrobiales bacterium]